MEILVIGDPHFRIDNIPEVELFITKIEALAKERNPKMIICLGDLLHTHERIHTIPLNKAYEFIKKLSVIAFTVVLVGNHDYIQNQQFLTENHWMNAMKSWENVLIVDKVIHLKMPFELHEFQFIFCPYVPNKRFEEALNTVRDFDWKIANCIFAHQEFLGCKMGAITSVDGDEWDLSYPKIVSGHIHSRQIPQPNIYYTGSALQHAFGESDKNTVAIMHFTSTDQYTLEEIDLGLPRKKIVYLPIDKVDAYVFPTTDDDIKLSISGSHEDFKAFKKTEKFKQLTKEGAKIVFKVEESTASTLSTSSSTLSTSSTEEQCDFKNILKNLVDVSQNPLLTQYFELVVNNKII